MFTLLEKDYKTGYTFQVLNTLWIFKLSCSFYVMEWFPRQVAPRAGVLRLCQQKCLHILLQAEMQVNRLPTDAISHFILRYIYFFYLDVLLCMIVNDLIFILDLNLFRMMEDGNSFLTFLPAVGGKEMLIMFSLFEHQHLQRPVKVTDSVYSVFDPVGNTQERP